MSELSAHHVGITVSDLEKTLAFYRDTLGLPVVDRFEVGGDAFADTVDVDGASARFVHLEAGGIRLELVAYDPGAPARSAPDLNETGAAHVGLALDDTCADLSKLRVVIEWEPEVSFDNGIRRVCRRYADRELVGFRLNT